LEHVAALRCNKGTQRPQPESWRLRCLFLAPSAHLWVFFTHIYSELGLGVNMKVAGMDVSFPMALV